MKAIPKGRIAIVVAAAAVCLVALAPAQASPAPDPYRGSQWGLDKIGAPSAWSTSTGTGAVIAVLDSGVDLDHPDLEAKILYHPDADLVEPKGTCNKNGKKCIQDGPGDRNGHGTMVAGIAAAVTDNGTGIAGVAPGASILPVRVLDGNGDGRAADLADGIRYATDKGADVINLSLVLESGDGVTRPVARPEVVYSAIDYAWSKGVVIVVAAGNASVPFCAEPSRHPHALCVAATDAGDLRTFYSNSDTSGEFLVAPGGSGLSCRGDIVSTYLVGATRSSCSPGSGYEVSSGTSLAAPHVSGVAALLAAGGLDNAAIFSCLVSTAKDLGTPGRDPNYGYGRVDAAAAMSCIPPA